MVASETLAKAISSSTATSLTQLLVEEAIVHFAQAVNHPPTTVAKSSKHPYDSHFELREKVWDFLSQ